VAPPGGELPGEHADADGVPGWDAARAERAGIRERGEQLAADHRAEWTAGDYWLGELDDLRVWNVVRTATDIQSNYRTELAAAPVGLVGSWRFDDGSGTVAVDIAGVPQNATLLRWGRRVPGRAVARTLAAHGAR